MIGGRKVLAVIPARGGSKGVPRKNLREVAGKPLIAWSIEAVRGCRHVDRLVLSSDDAEIIAVASRWGCEAPFVRPAALAQDDTPGVEPALHAIDMLPGYDLVVLLQPTSPLRSAADIDGCIALMDERGAPACVSVSPAEQSPYWMFALETGDRMRPLLPVASPAARRQDLPAAFVLNGAVYVADCAWLRQNRTFLADRTIGYVMPAERSLDIDTEFDLEILALRFKGAMHGNHPQAG